MFCFYHHFISMHALFTSYDFVVFGVTHYLDLCNAITSHFKFHALQVTTHELEVVTHSGKAKPKGEGWGSWTYEKN